MFFEDCSARPRARSAYALGTLAVLWLCVAGCQKLSVPEAEKKALAAEGGDEKTVELAPVTELPVEQTVEVSGTLAADQQVTVAVKVPGRLASIAVDLASVVKKGQALAQIEPTDYALRVEQAKATLAQARAQLGLAADAPDNKVDPETTAVVRQARAGVNQARADVERMRALAKEGLSTGMQLDAAEAQAVHAETTLQSAFEEVRIREASVRQRRSELNLAEQQLADTVLRAPLDGVVQMRRANVGEFLAQGAPVADIVRINPLRLRVSIPEREATPVKQGQDVQVLVEGDPAPYSGSVARVAPALDQDSRSLVVEADIPNPGSLRPGRFVHARIVLGSKLVPTAPQTSVVRFAGLEKVITVTDGKAIERVITTGRSVGERVEIVSGLKLGDAVVVRPGTLQQGQRVVVKKSN